MATTLQNDPNDATTTYTQPTPVPTAKVAAAGVGGISAVVIIGLLQYFGIQVDDTLANLIVAVVAFAAGYIKKSDTAKGAVKVIK